MAVLLEYIAPQLIKRRHRQWRTHDPEQHNLMCRSLRDHGVVQPPLIDNSNRVVCGALVVEAAIAMGLNSIPVIRVDHLTDDELRLYALKANLLADRGGYDEQLMAEELRELEKLLDLPDFSSLGLQQAELDRILKLTELDMGVDIDEVPPLNAGPAITRPGDRWTIGTHRLHCADALAAESYQALLLGETARFCLTDPPYNLDAATISGGGCFKHSNFAMAAGEMTPAQYTRFLTTFMRHMAAHSMDGSLHAIFMSYHYLPELLRAGIIVHGRPKAICTWVKRQGGQGSPFRSQTEFIAYFKNGNAPFLDNVQLGKFGRNRTTAWFYDGMNTPSAERDELLEAHPTPKNVEMLKDAILDTTRQGEIVLDPFCGIGSVILAAEATERRACTLELDPSYVDAALRRVRKATELEPVRDQDGASFSDLEREAWDVWEGEIDD